MKNILRYAFAALLGVLTFSSCTNDFEYDAAEKLQNAQVYFSSKLEGNINLSQSESKFTIPLNRVKTEEELTVNVASTIDGTNNYQIPTQVTFAAGSNEALIEVTYDPTQIAYDDFTDITFSISDETYTTPYGASAYTVTVGIPAPWKSLGKAMYREDFLTTFFDTGNPEYEVEIQENELYPGLYRLVYPYDGKYPHNEEGDWDDSKTYYIEIDAQNPDAVTIGKQQTGIDWKYGMISIWSMADNALQAGKPAAAAQYYGTLKDGVITFPVQSLLISMSGYDGGSWYYGNANGMFRVVLPGFKAADYSAELTYGGIYNNPGGEVFAVGNLTLGADAKTVKAVVVEGDADAGAVADAIAAGDLEGVDVAAGNIIVPIAEGLSGLLRMVVVVLDGNDVQNVASVEFEYFGGGKTPWESLGIGYYTDDFVVPMLEGGRPFTYPVEILENTETPGLYRIVNAYAPVAEVLGVEGGNKNIDIHAEDPNGVYFLMQPIGLDLGLGEIAIESFGGWAVAENGFDAVKANRPQWLGTLQNGVITLPTIAEQTPDGIMQFQGNTYMGTNPYYGCTNQAFRLVLPSAVPSAKAKAKRMAQATKFEKRMFSVRNNKAVKRNVMKQVSKFGMRPALRSAVK